MRMRLEFWNRNDVYGVTIRVGVLGFEVTEKTDQLLYDFLANAFQDAPSVLEYPQDDSGVSVVTLETIDSHAR